MPLSEEERPSPASSTSKGSNDNEQLIPLSWPEPSDVSAFYHLPAPYIPPIDLSTNGNLVSPLSSSSASSSFSSLEPFSTCPPTDVPRGGIYPGATKSIPDTLFPRNEPEFATESLSHMALPDIAEAFRELCTPSAGGFGAIANITSSRSDCHSVVSSNSGLATPADSPLPPSSTTAPMPDWCQLSNSLSLDQMIRQLASYRVHAAGVQGGEFSATQS